MSRGVRFANCPLPIASARSGPPLVPPLAGRSLPAPSAAVEA